MSLEEFKSELEKLGIKPTKEMLENLEIIYTTMVETNQTMNLTRITSKTFL